jgi:serine O-acetyltransferase
MNNYINWEIPDWDRERPRRFWDPGRKLLLSIRDYQKIKISINPFQYLRKKFCVLRHRFWSVVSGAEIDLSCNIGGGLLIPHPNGIVIHPDSRVGVNCLLFQQVTLAGAVKIGYHVDIGAGAKLIGPLTVGNNVRIGANAVVTKDIFDGLTVAGIPAVEIGTI